MSVQTSDIDQNQDSLEASVREELVQTAVKFLENPKVSGTPLAQKQKFLQRKGLSDREIQIACERSGAYVLHAEQNRVAPPPPPPLPYAYGAPFTMSNYGQIQQITFFQKIKEIVHSTALFGIVFYAIYKLYQNYIKPFLFGGRKKKSIEENVEALNKEVKSSVKELKENLQSVKIEVEKLSNSSETSTHRQLQTLQSEISTVKGLLLSRKQFPAVSSNPIVPQSIPAWQLSSVQTEGDQKGEDLLEIASGSSDPEQATKNSDSSLEIM